jgi:hypothetical protein
LAPLEFYRELLIVTRHRGNVLNHGIWIIRDIALCVLAELQHVEVACRIEQRFQTLRELWPLLGTLPGRYTAQIQILCGLVEIVLMTGLQECGYCRARVDTVQRISRINRWCTLSS